jgi:hypothetical protein
MGRNAPWQAACHASYRAAEVGPMQRPSGLKLSDSARVGRFRRAISQAPSSPAETEGSNDDVPPRAVLDPPAAPRRRGSSSPSRSPSGPAARARSRRVRQHGLQDHLGRRQGRHRPGAEGPPGQIAGQRRQAERTSTRSSAPTRTTSTRTTTSGLIFQNRGKNADAEDEYNKALAADEKFGPALYNLAILRTADKDN